MHLHRTARRGVTLVELLVVVAILGLLAGVAGLAFAARPEPRARDLALQRVADARREALATGRAVTVTVTLDSTPHAATARPDGSVLADSLPLVDALSGRPARLLELEDDDAAR